MKNRCTHVGELAKLFVGDDINGYRIFDQSRVCYQESGYICPVLIEICFHCSCYDGTSHIRASSGEGLDLSILICAVESRNNCLRHVFQLFFQQSVCRLCIKLSIFVKTNHLCGIHKRIADKSRHHNTVQVFSAGSRIITSCFIFKVLRNSLKFLIQRKLQVQPADNLIVTGFDLLDLSVKIFSVSCCIIALIQHICNLGISTVPFSRCRRNYITTAVFCQNDLSYFPELFCTGQ